MFFRKDEKFLIPRVPRKTRLARSTTLHSFADSGVAVPGISQPPGGPQTSYDGRATADGKRNYAGWPRSVYYGKPGQAQPFSIPAGEVSGTILEEQAIGRERLPEGRMNRAADKTRGGCQGNPGIFFLHPADFLTTNTAVLLTGGAGRTRVCSTSDAGREIAAWVSSSRRNPFS